MSDNYFCRSFATTVSTDRGLACPSIRRQKQAATRDERGKTDVATFSSCTHLGVTEEQLDITSVTGSVSRLY